MIPGTEPIENGAVSYGDDYDRGRQAFILKEAVRSVKLIASRTRMDIMGGMNEAQMFMNRLQEMEDCLGRFKEA